MGGFYSVDIKSKRGNSTCLLPFITIFLLFILAKGTSENSLRILVLNTGMLKQYIDGCFYSEF